MQPKKGDKWYSYGNQDAIDDIKNAFPNMIMRNEAIMNYAVNIGNLQMDKSDISGEEMRMMAQEVIRSFQKKELEKAVKIEKQFTPIPKTKEFTAVPKEVKVGDRIGRGKLVGVRKK